MKINQIIKEKRKQLGLTQENVAEYLGVSTPAVSKWENGTTYPDIMLLPALARLLKTDLNTLMSFNEEMSEIEMVGSNPSPSTNQPLPTPVWDISRNTSRTVCVS